MVNGGSLAWSRVCGFGAVMEGTDGTGHEDMLSFSVMEELANMCSVSNSAASRKEAQRRGSIKDLSKND